MQYSSKDKRIRLKLVRRALPVDDCMAGRPQLLRIQAFLDTLRYRPSPLRAKAAGKIGPIRCPAIDLSPHALMPSSLAAVPPRTAVRSSSLRPGVLRIRSTAVLVHG